MKHVKLIYWVIVFAGLFFSCYEDHSSLTYKLINPINIELGDESTEYTVFAYDTLEIKPIVYREGVEDADLSFRWTISGGAVPPTVLDTNMTFKAQIALTPSATAYDLLLEVYDKTTGIEVEQAFKVNVESPFGAGLIISETEDDIVSDVSLIRAYNFSSNFKQDQDTVMRNLFSLVNGRKIAGVGTAILSTKYGVYGQYLTIGTSTSIDRVDPYDYEDFKNGLKFLTEREKEILDLYIAGKTVKEIVALTGLKESTIRFHNRNIYTKLNVHSLKQLLRYAAIMKQEEGERGKTNGIS